MNKLDSSEDLIVRQFFLEANPNPERVGCPPEQTLKDAAEDRLPVTDPARLHMADCSECFAEYRGYRLDWQAKQASRRRSLGWAVAAALLIGVPGSFFAFRHHPQPTDGPIQVATNTPPNTVVVTSPKQNPDTPDPRGENPQKPHSPEQHHPDSHPSEPHPPRLPAQHDPPSETPSPPAPVTDGNELIPVTLNLSGVPIGGRGRLDKESYSLPALNLKLRILLPTNTQRGMYKVRLTSDVEGNHPIAESEAEVGDSEGAASLEVKLPLKGKKPDSYYLFIGPNGSDKLTVYGLKLAPEEKSGRRP